MLAPVDPLEVLSRFILQKKWYKPSDNSVKYAAFMPNKNNQTSVFRTSGISNNVIWDIGDHEVSAKLCKPILGRADVHASSVTEKDLEVIPSEPPERHADITGWPEEASKKRVIAIELAAEARFYKK